MKQKFTVRLLEDVFELFDEIGKDAEKKILMNLKKAQEVNDPELFKKLTDEIWEFRTYYNKTQYRLLAFWDKRDNKNTLVICTHGFIKKTQKTPLKELGRAERLMNLYLTGS